MLTVDVSFLAIPSVDTTSQGESASPVRTFAQISIYLSVVVTTCSLIVGFLLAQQTRTKSRDNAAEAVSVAC